MHGARQVVSRVAVGRHQHRAIDDQVVGVRRGQAAAFVDHRLCPRQREQAVRLAILGAQRGQFIAHRLQLGIVRVALVVAGLVDDAVGRGEAGEGVDVGVGVVAFQVAVVQPQYAVLLQPVGQVGTQAGAVAVRVALVQALPGGQQGAFAIGLDAAAFQRERNAAHRR
ncbi:hypothetical protein G6F55_013614 [Rhizopus delemar]|nr:hypothetical protein G6F55_013614 [Rhizopus delemar]